MNINLDVPEELKVRHEQFSNKMRDILDKYGVPDPKIVGKLPKGGIQLDYVSHAEITRILIEVDPCWDWEPVAFDANGCPAIVVANNMAHMTGRLTINGVSRIGVGSVAHNKPDLYKELVSDFLRNAAMRFGIALSLWSKQEWEDNNQPAPKQSKPATRPTGDAASTALTIAQQKQITEVCTKEGFNVKQLTDVAGVKLEAATNADLPKFREALRALISERDEA